MTATVPGPIAGGSTFTLPTLTLNLTAGSSGSTTPGALAGTSYSDPGLTFTAVVPCSASRQRSAAGYPTRARSWRRRRSADDRLPASWRVRCRASTRTAAGSRRMAENELVHYRGAPVASARSRWTRRTTATRCPPSCAANSATTWTSAVAETDVRVIVLDHTGPVFCSGMDLKEAGGADTGDQGVNGVPGDPGTHLDQPETGGGQARRTRAGRWRRHRRRVRHRGRARTRRRSRSPRCASVSYRP